MKESQPLRMTNRAVMGFQDWHQREGVTWLQVGRARHGDGSAGWPRGSLGSGRGSTVRPGQVPSPPWAPSPAAVMCPPSARGCDNDEMRAELLAKGPATLVRHERRAGLWPRELNAEQLRVQQRRRGVVSQRSPRGPAEAGTLVLSSGLQPTLLSGLSLTSRTPRTSSQEELKSGASFPGVSAQRTQWG